MYYKIIKIEKSRDNFILEIHSTFFYLLYNIHAVKSEYEIVINSLHDYINITYLLQNNNFW